MKGGSAVQAGERAEQKARQLEAAVEEARVKLQHAEQQLYAWRQGAEGERRTGAQLAGLEGRGWAVLHDLHWPGRPFANIDHIAVGPTGVYVIDSKNWSGRVEVCGGVLRQNGHGRDRECEGVASATGAVAAFLEPQHRALATAVLCLVAHPTPPQQPRACRVVGLEQLVTTLTAGPARIAPGDVPRIAAYLRALLDGSRSPEQKTTAVFGGLGVAPAEASATVRRRSHRPRRRPPVRRVAARPVQPRGRARAAGGGVAAGVVKLALIAALALYVGPKALQAIADSMTSPLSTPSVVVPHPSAQTPTTSAKPGSRARPVSR